MPRYEYECESCEEEIQIFHSLNEELTSCPSCGSETIKKSFKTPIAFSTKKEKVGKTGELVKEFIQEAREDLKNEKRDLDLKR